MSKPTRLSFVVATLLVLAPAVGCDQTNSLGTNNLTPQQACAGKPCGTSCAACSTGSCTNPDIEGACGLDGLCSAATPLCASPKADAGDPGAGGGAGSGGVSSSGDVLHDAGVLRGDGSAGASGSAGSGGIGGTILTGGTTSSGASAGAGGSAGAGATGSSSARDAGITDGPGQCERNGKRYDIGVSISLGDGCNYCVCSTQYGPPQFMCTGMICSSGGATSSGGSSGVGGTSGTIRTSASGGVSGSGGTSSMGGVTGTGGVGGASGSASSSGRCGDPVVMARYPTCMASTTSSACTSNGGTWSTQGARSVCVCPTGQDGCTCTSPSDCLALCALPVQGSECPNTTQFTCTSKGGTQGCFCRVGDANPICIN